MRKTILYIAMSLNAKIAKTDGSVEWLENLPNPDKTDYGYNDFLDSIDTTIQGNSTYKQILDWNIPFPYPEKENFVFTNNPEFKDNKDVKFISENHIDLVKQLKKKKGKDIWVIGGGKINSMLLNSNMIDEIIVFVMPIILQDGINLFESFPKETMLKLTESKAYVSGAIELKYSINKSSATN